MDRISETLGAVERNAESIKGTLERMQNERGIQNVTSFNVNAGGAVVWGMTICCAFLCGLCVVLGLVVLDHSRKIDRAQEHLNAIYMMAPHLKPKESQ